MHQHAKSHTIAKIPQRTHSDEAPHNIVCWSRARSIAHAWKVPQKADPPTFRIEVAGTAQFWGRNLQE